MSRGLQITVSSIFILVMFLLSVRFYIFRNSLEVHKPFFRYETLLSAAGKGLKILSVPAEKLFADKKGLEWTNNKTELIVDGKFYEVLGIQCFGSEAKILLAEDVKESSLFLAFFSASDPGEENAPLLSQLLIEFNFITSKKLTFCRQLSGADYFFTQRPLSFPSGVIAETERPPAASFPQL